MRQTFRFAKALPLGELLSAAKLRGRGRFPEEIFMNESEKIDPRELSPLALAFVGDSVLELLVRQRLAEHHRLSAGQA